MSKLKIRTTRIHLTTDSILHDRAFSVEIADEGGGEFVIIQSESGELAIDPEEWPTLREAIDMIFSNILKEEQGEDKEWATQTCYHKLYNYRWCKTG